MVIKSKEQKVTQDSIFIQIDDERIELLGEAKMAFLAQKTLDDEEERKHAAQIELKQSQRSAILERLGITADEAKLLIG